MGKRSKCLKEKEWKSSERGETKPQNEQTWQAPSGYKAPAPEVAF